MNLKMARRGFFYDGVVDVSWATNQATSQVVAAPVAYSAKLISAIGTGYVEETADVVVQPESDAPEIDRETHSTHLFVTQNGLVKDWSPPGFDPDHTKVLMVDASAQDWQPSTEVSNSGNGSPDDCIPAIVHRVGDDSVRFLSFENGSAVTGSAEPTWSTDGVTIVDDGTTERPLSWTPDSLWSGAWQATTALVGTGIFNGWAWQSNGGGNSGGSEPTWPDSPNTGDSVSDGSITWSPTGPAAVWSAGERFSFIVDSPAPSGTYQQFLTVGTGAVAGVDYVFMGQPTGLFGTTGEIEPDWGTAITGDASVWIDGDIMWSEDANSAQACVITGLVAPGDLASLTVVAASIGNFSVTLEDHGEILSDFAAVAESAAANSFVNDAANVPIPSGRSCLVTYYGGKWHAVFST